MTAHELAAELLKCPDVPVMVHDDTGAVSSVSYVDRYDVAAPDKRQVTLYAVIR